MLTSNENDQNLVPPSPIYNLTTVPHTARIPGRYKLLTNKN